MTIESFKPNVVVLLDSKFSVSLNYLFLFAAKVTWAFHAYGKIIRIKT